MRIDCLSQDCERPISESGGLRPTGKSFRFVRACVRAHARTHARGAGLGLVEPALPSQIWGKSAWAAFPFSLFARPGDRLFSLQGGLVRPNETK